MKFRTLSILIALAFICLPALTANNSASNPNQVDVTSNPNQVDAVKKQDHFALVDVLRRLRTIADKIPTEEPRAEYLWSCIVNLDKTIYGPTSAESIEDLRKLAECVRFLRLYKGESYELRSMSLYQLKLESGLQPVETYMISYELNELADSYLQEEDYASADLVMDKAVAADKKGDKEGAICLPGDLITSAMIKRMRYDHEGANECVKSAIAAHEKVYGPHPKDPALFASASKSKDIAPYKFDTAITEFERLTQKDAQDLEPTDAHTGLDHFQLADAYFCLGEEELAKALWKRARIIETIARTEKVRGTSKDQTKELSDLADSFAAANEFTRAEQLMRRATKDSAAEGQLRMARFYLKSKRYKESQDEYLQVLRKYAGGGIKTYHADAWTELADAYDKDGKVKLAQDTYEDGLLFFTKRNDKNSLGNILKPYAGFMRVRGHLDEAEILRKKADDAISAATEASDTEETEDAEK
jgi:tetratricopeptide (TPR) repeat protein